MLLALLWGLSAAAGAQVRYEPSPANVVQAMLDLAAVNPRDRVYDLGCGDGRIVVAAARLGAAAVCVDIDPQRIREAQDNARQAGVAERIEFRNQDLFTVDLRDATVVMLFLSADFNRRLEPRLRSLPPGTRVVSHWHSMPTWRPQKWVSVPSGWREHPVYLWVVGEP
ncbi:MAG TPA: methyltransferase domain-containing protein [Burkholderiales bacterium]|nr:methyltransferase domain-containing protein [Burkholderiales bacterium]